MLKTVLRLLLVSLFAFVGMIVGVIMAPILPGGCMMGMMGAGMVGGSVLGSLLGSCIAMPRGGVSPGQRVLSFILAPAVAIPGMYGYFLLVGDIPREYRQYEWAVLLALFLLVIPGLSLLGFSLPVLLSAKRT